MLGKVQDFLDNGNESAEDINEWIRLKQLSSPGDAVDGHSTATPRPSAAHLCWSTVFFDVRDVEEQLRLPCGLILTDKKSHETSLRLPISLPAGPDAWCMVYHHEAWCVNIRWALIKHGASL